MRNHHRKQFNIFPVIAIVLAAVLLLGACLQIFGTGKIKPSEWFKKDEEQTDPLPDPDVDPKDCTHAYAEGSHVCVLCGYVSVHVYDEGDHACKICGKLSPHEYNAGSHVCLICGEISPHDYAAGSHVCTVCGETSPHEYVEGSHECTVCGETSPHEFNERGYCTTCGAECEHVFENEVCTICGVSSIIYTVTLNVNSEEAAFEDGETTKTIQIRKGITLPDLPSPVRHGYTFKNAWFTNKLASERYTFDLETPITKNMTLYAGWSVNYYTVTFADNGADTPVRANSIRYGNTVSRPIPTKEGYVFGGWFTRRAVAEGTTTENYAEEYVGTSEGATFLYSLYDFTTPVVADITLYARWVDPETCDHHFTDGTCVICGTECVHSYEDTNDGMNHVCTVCGKVSAHTYADGSCSVCGACETHAFDTQTGVCSVCGKREITYTLNSFPATVYDKVVKQNSSPLPVCMGIGETVNLHFDESITATLDDGVQYVLSITSIYVELYFEYGYGYSTPVEFTQSGNTYSFAVPAEDGSLRVEIQGTYETVLPDGYHYISNEVREENSTGTTDGAWILSCVSYAKEGEVVSAELFWTSWGEGGSTGMYSELSSISMEESTGVTNCEYVISEDKQSAVIYFTMTDADANLIITVSY